MADSRLFFFRFIQGNNFDNIIELLFYLLLHQIIFEKSVLEDVVIIFFLHIHGFEICIRDVFV